MKLKHLTLNKIVDAAYYCGLDNTPISLIIAAPPGAGKTWSTRSISESDFVMYISGTYSPNEHRKIIKEAAARTRLIINDDLGLTSRWNQAEYYATFAMIADGRIQYTVWRTSHITPINCSMVLCCTFDYYKQNRDKMVEMGLIDRIVPVVLGLSFETRKQYQKYREQTNIRDSAPLPRNPAEPPNPITVKTDLISKKDIDPRLFLNLQRLSQYLTEDETIELIEVSHGEGRYEI
jgi:hypothetical protein